MSENHAAYYLVRADEEDRCATAATGERARAAHLELAAAYRARVAEELHERDTSTALSALPVTFWSPVFGPAMQAALKIVVVNASDRRDGNVDEAAGCQMRTVPSRQHAQIARQAAEPVVA